MRALRAIVLFGVGVAIGWLTWDSVQAWFDDLDLVTGRDW